MYIIHIKDTPRFHPLGSLSLKMPVCVTRYFVYIFSAMTDWFKFRLICIIAWIFNMYQVFYVFCTWPASRPPPPCTVLLYTSNSNRLVAYCGSYHHYMTLHHIVVNTYKPQMVFVLQPRSRPSYIILYCVMIMVVVYSRSSKQANLTSGRETPWRRAPVVRSVTSDRTGQHHTEHCCCLRKSVIRVEDYYTSHRDWAKEDLVPMANFFGAEGAGMDDVSEGANTFLDSYHIGGMVWYGMVLYVWYSDMKVSLTPAIVSNVVNTLSTSIYSTGISNHF